MTCAAGGKFNQIMHLRQSIDVSAARGSGHWKKASAAPDSGTAPQSGTV